MAPNNRIQKTILLLERVSVLTPMNWSSARLALILVVHFFPLQMIVSRSEARDDSNYRPDPKSPRQRKKPLGNMDQSPESPTIAGCIPDNSHFQN
jgi:hypothetical protein